VNAAAEQCPFCDRIQRREFDRGWRSAVAFEPLDPVVPGHMLVVPRLHVPDATTDLLTTARVMRIAALLASDLIGCNIITSIGTAATQTVFHLNVHVIPRRPGDGLMLPWTGQQKAGEP
jgi:histidine triad (HIT) family protein